VQNLNFSALHKLHAFEDDSGKTLLVSIGYVYVSSQTAELVSQAVFVKYDGMKGNFGPLRERSQQGSNLRFCPSPGAASTHVADPKLATPHAQLRTQAIREFFGVFVQTTWRPPHFINLVLEAAEWSGCLVLQDQRLHVGEKSANQG
jgi:hypothetical protein